MDNRCVACGCIIPEGRQICRQCEEEHVVKKELPEWVKVVRCKDCEHYSETHHSCLCHSEDVEEDDFCSWGERKE